MYQSRAVLPSQAAEQQARARTLAEEIRATDPSNELVLSVASDLDELVGALGFALAYARNSGVDATALGEMLETP